MEGRLIASLYLCEGLTSQDSLGPRYRAKRTDGHQVTLQAVPPRAGDLRRIERDLQIAAGLRHPNLPAASALLPDQGALYLVREQLDGETLYARMRRVGRPPAEAAFDLLERVADALGAAHKKDLFHLRLRPDKIFLQRGGATGDVVCVLDLGLSSLHPSGPTHGPALEARYTAPEQVLGVTTPNARTDVYTLGLIFFELLTGSPPFTAEDAAILLAQHLNDRPSTLTDRSPDRLYSAELEGLVASMLAKAPQNRPAHAGVVLSRLRELRKSGDLIIVLDDREQALQGEWHIAPPQGAMLQSLADSKDNATEAELPGLSARQGADRASSAAQAARADEARHDAHLDARLNARQGPAQDARADVRPDARTDARQDAPQRKMPQPPQPGARRKDPTAVRQQIPVAALPAEVLGQEDSDGAAELSRAAEKAELPAPRASSPPVVRTPTSRPSAPPVLRTPAPLRPTPMTLPVVAALPEAAPGAVDAAGRPRPMSAADALAPLLLPSATGETEALSPLRERLSRTVPWLRERLASAMFWLRGRARVGPRQVPRFALLSGMALVVIVALSLVSLTGPENKDLAPVAATQKKRPATRPGGAKTAANKGPARSKPTGPAGQPAKPVTLASATPAPKQVLDSKEDLKPGIAPAAKPEQKLDPKPVAKIDAVPPARYAAVSPPPRQVTRTAPAPRQRDLDDDDSPPRRKHSGRSERTRPAPPVQTGAPAATEPTMVTVRLLSTPAGAEVMRDGQIIGTTPFSEALTRQSQTLSYQLVRAGYSPVKVQVVPSRDRLLQFELSPIMLLK